MTDMQITARPEYLDRINAWAQGTEDKIDFDGAMVPTRVAELIGRAMNTEQVRERMSDYANRLIRVQAAVHDAMQSWVDDGTLEREEANELLEAIGAGLLSQKYRATLTVEVEVSFESTADADDLVSQLEDLDVQVDSYCSDLEDLSTDGARVSSVDLAED